MKKKILTGLLVLLMVGSTAGCVSKQEINDKVSEFFLRVMEDDSTDEMKTSAETTEEPTTKEASETTEATTAQTTSDTAEVATVQATEAIPQEQELWKEAYIAKLQELNSLDFGLLGAVLVDVDRDGIPELIAYTLNEGDLYTYADGQLIAMEYPAAHVGERFYQSSEYLIAVSYGLDCMSGASVTITRKQGNILGCDEYWLHWDENMNPFVNIFRSAGSETPEYTSACQFLEQEGIHVTYENCMDGDVPFLEYDISVDGQEVPCYYDLDSIIAAIRAW